MPLPQNVNALLGAGVFGIVCAATLYVIEHYRQDRRRHAMAKDLARLDTELSVLRQELNALLALQKQKVAKRGKRSKRADSFISTSSTTDEYNSAFDGDSSDLEFYDVSDEELDAPSLDKELGEIDSKLDKGSSEEVEACLQRLEILRVGSPEDPQLLWRIAMAHYKLFEKTEDQDHITKGIEACKVALNFEPKLAEVHKWMAVLVGTRTRFLPIREKILDGHLFKEHVDAAVKLNPQDPSIHHMLGRFAYDLAELKWYERKVAAALVAEPPEGTYGEALEHFEEAEKLSTNEWKENKLYIAKCHIQLGDTEEAVKVLEKADAIATQNGVDNKIDIEVKELLKKYSQ